MRSRAWVKGDEYLSRSGQVLKKASGLWAITCSHTCVADAAQDLLKILSPSAKKIRTVAQDLEATVAVSVWWEPEGGQGGFTVPGATLMQLAEIGEQFNFYFPG
jgi:hypothetical protein